MSRFIVIAYAYKLELANFSPLTSGCNDFTFSAMTLDDLDYMHSNYKTEMSDAWYEKLRHMLTSTSSEGFMLRCNSNDNIAGYGLIRYDVSKPYDIKYVSVNENGYLSRDYMFYRYRGRGLHKYLIAERLRILIDQNYRTATTYIIKTNYASRHSYEKAGFRKCLRIIHLRLLDRKYYKFLR